jgi:hypothetical protein
MKRLTLLLLLPMLFVWAVGPALAQQDGLYIEAERTVEIGPITAAAQPLIDRGAQVALFLVGQGGFEDANARLQANGWMEGDLIADNLIAIYVSFDPNYSEIIYGDQFVSALEGRAEGIRTEFLNPNLRERQYTLALTRTLEAIERILLTPAPNPFSGQVNFATPIPYSPPNFDFGPPESESDGMTPFLLCIFLPMIVISWLYQQATGGYRGDDDDSSYGGRPLYKSNWSSGSRSGGSSRSSISRSSGGGRSSSGRGGRSGGSW